MEEGKGWGGRLQSRLEAVVWCLVVFILLNLNNESGTADCTTEDGSCSEHFHDSLMIH